MARAKLTVLNGTIHFLVNEKPTIVPSVLLKEFEDAAADFYSETRMKPPARSNLPFFAYGLFKPGQLGFDSLRKHINTIADPEYVEGILYERDGVPLFVGEADQPKQPVKGALLYFETHALSEAYGKIANLEPQRQYEWRALRTKSGVEANILVARNTNGAQIIYADSWDGWLDPHFSIALNLVESLSGRSSQYEWGTPARLFELQMAYMLLWTAIERYTSLRYHLRKKVMAKLRHIEDEPGFRHALKKYVRPKRSLYSTDAGEPVSLSADDPHESLSYYYQIRCNISHRGKSSMTDAVLLSECISELLAIFRETLQCAFNDCEWPIRQAVVKLTP